jgi:hypothetical protein
VDVSKLFDYAAVTSAYGVGNDSDLKFRTRLPVPAARDTMTILHGIDPSLGHVRAVKAAAAHIELVAAGAEPGLHQQSMSTDWTTDGVAPEGNTYTLGGIIDVVFGDSHAMLGAPGYPPFRSEPCDIEPADLAAVNGEDPNATWSPCSVRTLADGSTVSTSTSKRGPGTLVFAVREFPGGRGGIAVLAIDHPLIPAPSGQQLDAAHVLTPSPWTEQSLADVLSLPELTPAL